MDSIERIRKKIQILYETNPNIYIDINISRPKTVISGVPAVIKGVYPNIFYVEENTGGCVRRHSVQYAEVLMGQVSIREAEH